MLSILSVLSFVFDSNFNTTFENLGYVDDLPARVFGISCVWMTKYFEHEHLAKCFVYSTAKRTVNILSVGDIIKCFALLYLGQYGVATVEINHCELTVSTSSFHLFGATTNKMFLAALLTERMTCFL